MSVRLVYVLVECSKCAQRRPCGWRSPSTAKRLLRARPGRLTRPRCGGDRPAVSPSICRAVGLPELVMPINNGWPDCKMPLPFCLG